MADFGTDIGNQAAQISANAAIKLMEALASLMGKSIKYLSDYNSAESKMARMKLKDMKSENEKREFLKSLNLSGGVVNHATLVKYDVPLVCFGMDNKMTEREFKDFSKICEDEGVIISGVKTKDAGKSFFVLHCRESDMPKLDKCLQKCVAQQVLRELDIKLSGFEDKGLSNLSQAERLERADLLNQRGELLNQQNRMFNDTQINSVIGSAYTVVEPEHRENFERALNRMKGNSINKDVNFVVADMANPERHIKCNARMELYKDETGQPFEHKGRRDYIKTDYQIYNGENLIMQADDGWENIKDAKAWVALRNEMQTTGEFSGEMLRFETVNDYNAFMNQRALTNEAEKGIVDISNYRDCSEVTGKLEDYLLANGCEISYFSDENGLVQMDTISVIDSASRKPVIAPNGDVTMEGLVNADFCYAGRKIGVYKNLEWHSNEKYIAETEMKSFKEGTAEFKAAAANFDKASENIKSLENDINEMNTERRKLISGKAEHSLREDIEHSEHSNIRAEENMFGISGESSLEAGNTDIVLADIDKSIKQIKAEFGGVVDKGSAEISMPAFENRG